MIRTGTGASAPCRRFRARRPCVARLHDRRHESNDPLLVPDLADYELVRPHPGAIHAGDAGDAGRCGRADDGFAARPRLSPTAPRGRAASRRVARPMRKLTPRRCRRRRPFVRSFWPSTNGMKFYEHPNKRGAEEERLCPLGRQQLGPAAPPQRHDRRRCRNRRCRQRGARTEYRLPAGDPAAAAEQDRPPSTRSRRWARGAAAARWPTSALPGAGAP